MVWIYTWSVHQNSHVAIINIPGAYPHTDTDKQVTILIKWIISELIALVGTNL